METSRIYPLATLRRAMPDVCARRAWKPRQTNPRIRYPYNDKHYYPLLRLPCRGARAGNADALSRPLGRGRPSLVFKRDLPEQIGGCKLVWKDGYELPVSVPTYPAATAPGQAQATVDLGEVHQADVTTNTGGALEVFGRGIRSLKRRHHLALRQLARKRKRCKPGSRRPRRLWAARRRVSARKRSQIRESQPQGHAARDCLLPAPWRGEPGQDITNLRYKAKQARHPELHW